MTTVRGSGVALDDGDIIGSVAYSIRHATDSVRLERQGHMTGSAAVLHQLLRSRRAKLRLSSGEEVAVTLRHVNSDGAPFVVAS